MKDLGLLLLRVVAGGTLAAHGYTKLFGGEGRTAPPHLARLYGQNFAQGVQTGGPGNFKKMLENMEVPYPTVGAYLSGVAEFGGGLALLAGIKTRLAALIVMGNMAVAIWKVHWKTGFYGQGGYEFPLQLMGAAAALFLAGPGAVSIDGIVSGTQKAAEAVGEGARGAAEAVGGGARGAAGALGGLGSNARRTGGMAMAALPRRR